MFNFTKKLIASSALALLLGSAANAQVILEIDNVLTTAGSSFSVGITASSTDSTLQLVGADLPLDFSNIADGDGLGLGVPTGLTFNGFTSAFESDVTGGGAPSEDLFAGGFTFGGTPTSLPSTIVTLDFTVDSGVAGGTVFNIDFLETTFSGLDTLSVTDSNFASSTPNVTNGTITITVPEPGSAALMMVAFSGLALCRRRAR